jgi:hypothetical protein
MKIRVSIFLVLALVLTLTSCNLPVDGDTLNTAVAATLAVVESGGVGDPKGSDSPDATAAADEDPAPVAPSDTPEPTGPGVLTIVYISGGNVWFYQEGSSPVQLTTSGNALQVVITQDGQLVAFFWHNSSTDVFELRVVQTATGTESVLLTQADLDAFYPLDGAIHHIPYLFEFIPGTHTVLMNTRKTFEGPGLVQNNDLWSIDADSGARTSLFTPGLGGDFYLSPSGSRLALVQATTIGFANADGSGRSPDHLTFPPVITYSEYLYYPVAVWAPDESEIVVVIPPEDPFLSDTARVWSLPVSGGSTHLVDLAGFNFFRNQRRTPLIAPDTSKVVFMRETAPNTFDLVVTPLDGSPESVYTSGDISWQGWSPDSTQFAYTDAPRNYMRGGLGLPSAGVGFGAYLRWVDGDTLLYLDQFTATHRFGKVDIPGPAAEIAVISGQMFEYDFTE